MSFLYLSCSAIPGGEFNSYKSKRLADVKYFKLENIVIVEDFRIMDTIIM